MEEKKRITCDEVLDNLRDFLDERERAELCHQIEEHLKHCHDCQIEVDTIRKTIVLYQADRETPVPIKVRSALQAAMANEYSSSDRKKRA